MEDGGDGEIGNKEGRIAEEGGEGEVESGNVGVEGAEHVGLSLLPDLSWTAFIYGGKESFDAALKLKSAKAQT